MKVEVEIPERTPFCLDCELCHENLMTTGYDYICGWNGEYLDYAGEQADCPILKHPDCPSLKEKK